MIIDKSLFETACNKHVIFENDQYNQLGGNNEYIKKLHKIKEKIKKKGFGFWFDEDGKLISKNESIKNAHKKVVTMITNDKELWKNKILVEIKIDFHPDEILDEQSGGLELDINVNKVIIDGKNISIQQKDTVCSLMRLFYKYDELDNFKLTDLKKIALMFIDKKIKKTNPFKYYHYGDILKYID